MVNYHPSWTFTDVPHTSSCVPAGEDSAAWEEVTVLYSASWISSEEASVTDDSLFLSDYLQVTANAANVDISAVRITACEVCCDDDQMGSPPPSDAAPNRRHVLGLDLPHRKLQSSSIESQCKVLQDASTFGSALSGDQARHRSLLAGDAVTSDTCDSTVAGDRQRRLLATEESKIWDMIWVNTSVAFGPSTSSAAEFSKNLQTPSIIYNEQVWPYDVPNITDIQNVTITKGDNIWPASIEVCGTIQSNTVWYRNTTYYLTCQVFVNHTADLVIEPDTVVHAFKEHYNGVLILVTDENGDPRMLNFAKDNQSRPQKSACCIFKVYETSTPQQIPLECIAWYNFEE